MSIIKQIVGYFILFDFDKVTVSHPNSFTNLNFFFKFNIPSFKDDCKTLEQIVQF